MSDSALRLTRTDYQSHRDALLSRVRARWPGVWTDFTTNSLGMMMVDLMAYTTSTLAFTLNALASEQFVPTMSLRESAVRIGALTGYSLRGPIPATVMCEASIASAGGTPETPYVRILKGTVIRVGDDNVPFEVAREYTIYGGKTTPESKVLTLDANLTGTNVLSTNLRVQNGQNYIDAVDSSVDLAALISPGQAIRRMSGDLTAYTITSIEAQDDGGAYSRLYISPSWNSSPSEAAEIIPAEVIDKRIELVQSQTVTEQFTTPQQESPLYSVKLSQTPVVEGSISVTVGGVPWESVKSTVSSSPTDPVYEIMALATGDTIISFGNGVNGQVIPQDTPVVVTYKIGGGTAGNVPLNTVNTTITGFVVSLSNPVSVKLTNLTSPGQGGRNAETLEEARVNIPFWTRANNRAVTIDDWQTLAGNYSGLGGSIAYARASVNVANSFLEGNVVFVYAWTTGPDGSLIAPSPALKDELQQFLATKAVGTDYPVVMSGTERPVPISLRVKVLAGYEVAETVALVNAKIASVVRTLRPGSPIVHSDLVRSLDEVTGVDSITMSTPTSDLKATSPSELFTVPRDGFFYSIQRAFIGAATATISGSSVPINRHSIQLPVFPLAPWSFKLYLGSTELTVIPDATPGYARVLGLASSDSGIVDDDFETYKSRINLLTGQGEIVLFGSPGDLTMSLASIEGYSHERLVDVFIGYSGTNTVEKRNEIRSALRAWSNGLEIGGSVFAKRVSGLAVSRSSITDVVRSISGVLAVNRVALENPANSEDRANATAFELLRLGSIVLNNHTV